MEPIGRIARAGRTAALLAAILAAGIARGAETPAVAPDPAGTWELSGAKGTRWKVRTDADGRQELSIEGASTATRREDGSSVAFHSLSAVRDPASGAILRAELHGAPDAPVRITVPAVENGHPVATVLAPHVEYRRVDPASRDAVVRFSSDPGIPVRIERSEEHTSELQ